MRVLHRALLQSARTPTSWCGPRMRQVPSRREKLPQRLDLFRRGFLFGDHVIQAEDHQRVGVGEDSLVERQSLAGLIDALIDCTG